MKAPLLLIKLVMLFPLASLGQNFQLFPSGRTLFFSISDPILSDLRYAFQADSSWHEGNELVVQNYQSPTVCETEFSESYTYGWMSRPYRYDSLSGAYRFLNQDSLAITFLNSTHAGEQWVMFSDSAFYIEAFHTLTETRSFLGITDSVRVIELQAYDHDSLPISNDWNGRELLLSQNHGVLEFIQVDKFPSSTHDMRLAGISNPDLGHTGLTSEDFVGLNEGDLLHYQESSSYTNSGPGGQTSTTLVKWKFLQDLGDGEFEIERMSFEFSYEDYTKKHDTIFTFDTITKTFPDFDPLPFFTPVYEKLLDTRLPYKESSDGFISYGFNSASQRFTKTINLATDSLWFSNGLYNYYYNADDACWAPNIYHSDSYKMHEGIGMVFYNRNSSSGSTSSSSSRRQLKYYKNATESWGDSLDFSQYKQFQDHFYPVIRPDNFAFYPNPVTNKLFISLPPELEKEQIQIRFSDLSGKTLFRKVFVQEDLFINLANLKPGVYIARLFRLGRPIYIDKIMVQ